jgi:dTDP-4-amino-4,6-dideoxygalactose transaminase
MMTEPSRIVLFHPHLPEGAAERVTEVLQSRWIGQGPLVDEFERQFSDRFCGGLSAIAVGSGTDALHLSYVLAGLQPGDEVIAPVLTCVATTLPLLYLGVTVIFADIDHATLNIDPADVRRRVTSRTRAIVCVHYGGLPCDLAELQAIADEFGLVLIQDAAHALGATYAGRQVAQFSDFTAFSFQAVKHLTTGDGGMLVVKDPHLVAKARRLRWFGIDRAAKHCGAWANEICEIGYKYQMTDIAAALGLAALPGFDEVLALRQRLLSAYVEHIGASLRISGVGVAASDRTHAAWLCTVLIADRAIVEARLRRAGIEAAQVHYRNDRYRIFGTRREDCPVMDELEDQYLCLPLHTRLSMADVERIVDVMFDA